jgi:hypothetical protein
MTEDSTKEFIVTTQRMESVPAVHATMTVPPQTAVPQAEVGFPFERCHTHHGGRQAQACPR